MQLNLTYLQLLPDALGLNLDAINNEQELRDIRSHLLHAMEGLKELANYAESKADAVHHRKAGNIERALYCERVCDAVYARMPESYKTW